MSYFPAFIKLKDKKILIVGGGNIAYEKLCHLLDFTDDISVIATKYNEQMINKIKEYSLRYEQRAYQEGDIKDFAIVIIAVDDIPLQDKIYKESKRYKCLCNAVDSVEYCDFIFPSYIKRDDLVVAVSTSGSSPAFAKHFRKYLQTHIPENVGRFLQQMKELRKTLPKGKERMKLLDEKVKQYISKW